MDEHSIVKTADIQNRIYTIRNVQVMLDIDLAKLYDVETKVLNQAVKRNIERFPQEFSFQLTAEENDFLKSQIVTLEKRREKHRKYLPYVFTEQGVAMLSGDLKSEKAVQIGIQIINAQKIYPVTLRCQLSPRRQASRPYHSSATATTSALQIRG